MFFLMLLTAVFQEADYFATVTDQIHSLERTYLNDELTDNQIIKRQREHEENILAAIKKLGVTDIKQIVYGIDFERSFEAYFLLGYMLKLERRLDFAIGREKEAQVHIHLYDRCITSPVFRKEFCRYVVWTNDLATYATDGAVFYSFVAIMANYREAEYGKPGDSLSSLMFVVYAELFGVFDDFQWNTWEEEAEREGANIKAIKKQVNMLIITGTWQRYQGYAYRKRLEGEKSNRIQNFTEGDPPILERFANHPDTFPPILPFSKCSDSLLNF